MLGRSGFPLGLPLLALRVPYFCFFNAALSFEWAWVFFSLSFHWSATSSDFFRKYIQVAYLLFIYMCVIYIVSYIYVYIYESLPAAFKT